MNGIVLITGGSGGIGSALARRVVAAGRRVALVARRREPLAALAAELGAAARIEVCDVLDDEAFAAVVARIEDGSDEIDGVVNAVGSILIRPLHATSLADWRATLELNATSAFIVLRHTVVRMMRRKRGSVVLFSSVAASTALVNHEAIAAAKGAVAALARTAAVTYARYGIRVNAIAPSLTRTAMAQNLWGNELALKASLAMHPLARIGEPDDVAAAAFYLLDDASSWTTGQVIGVDGGLGAGHPPPRERV